MRIEFSPTSWNAVSPTTAAIAASELLDGVWRQAATEFVAVRSIRIEQGKRDPKGIQSFLNKAIDFKFGEAGWDGEAGRYRLGNTWVRISFRHQMSIGSDFLDAIKLNKQEGVEFAAICAAPLAFLKFVSPNDASVLTSFEKILLLADQLAGVIEFPLMVGELKPVSAISPEVERVIRSPRQRG